MIKKILIQGAMDKEIEVFLNNMNSIERMKKNGYEFYVGNIDDKKIIISKTNIGVINASVATILGLNLFAPDLVINQGCSGGYGNMNIGDIVVASDVININSYETDYESEIGIILKTFKSSVEGGDIEGEFVPSDNEYTDKIYNYLVDNYNKNVVKGILGSGDCWNKNKDKINYLYNKYNVLGEDMESIAAFKVCNNNNVKVVGIRIISNNELLGLNYDLSVVYTLQELILKYIKQM